MIEQIIEAIIKERKYQDESWGTVEENPHEIGQWLQIMRRELDAASAAYSACHDCVTLSEILQVIAVGVACLEQHGLVERIE